MDGFKRPARRVPSVSSMSQQPRPLDSQTMPPTIRMVQQGRSAAQQLVDDKNPKKNLVLAKKRKKWPWALGALVLILCIAAGACYGWYQHSLAPVDKDTSTEKWITIRSGMRPREIAATLKEQGMIRNSLAFEIYVHQVGIQGKLQAGTCLLTTNLSVSEIASRLSEGCHDFQSVTFYPGGTLVDSLYKPQKQDATTALRRAGYTDAQINAALTKTYTGALFEGKPTGTSLEGYLYGDTYYVALTDSPEVVLQTAFDHMYKQIKSNGLVEKFNAQGLNLYQGITLASIVQREMGCGAKDQDAECYQTQRQIAQVFYKRLREGKVLGSDVTFIYGADLLGVTPTTTLNSPYNTRVRTGLPPGPIATPGLGALKATANPASGDYEFFLAGDDGKVYFAKTDKEHEANIVNHCQKLCSEL